ncbi:MAG: hypothetical protein OIN86_11455 [Candidatus Methanoperedens sp.]|nr:hypothetical protein [Candidatus Methanoperedens sp.]CAG0987411.1 hypothetical protein METP1_02108 [Methanosarcinales archaeon]
MESTEKNESNCRGEKKFMEQIEVNKQSPGKLGEVSAAIAKPPEGSSPVYENWLWEK